MPAPTSTESLFRSLLGSPRPILADGAMGTSLFALGLMSGDSPECWNLDSPERVRQVHRSYLEAGSDLLLTNSFGGNVFRLKLHNLEDQVFELNRAAALIAAECGSELERPVVIAGSMGPTGELLVPMGAMTPEECSAAFADQARGLEAGGAHVLWLETLSDMGEVRAAVAGVRSVSELPIVVTMSFDTNGRTMMGLTAANMATELLELGVDAFGANCGNNLGDTEAAIAEMQAAAPNLPLVCKANAGIPEWKGQGLTYSGTPEIMAAHAHRLQALGVRIIGGCCGSDAEHLQQMRLVLDGDITVPDVPAPTVTTASGNATPQKRRTRRRSR